MAGFDLTSPGENSGYRSKALGGAGQRNYASYNGFVFPPAINTKVTVVPEYDRGGRVTKYLTVALQIEFIYTEPSIKPSEMKNDRSHRLKSEGIYELMGRLSQPGQGLRFFGQGLGDFQVNTDGGSPPIFDIDNGPKPQVVEMEPLGGGAAYRVQWLCVTRISPLVDDYDGKFVELNYGVKWSTNYSGHMVRTISGNVEFPAIQRFREIEEQAERYDIPLPVDLIKDAKLYILKKFPHHYGFERSIHFELKPDKKSLDFSIEDMERTSISVYPPGVAKMELDQNVTSTLDDGFCKWKVTYTGSIETCDAEIDYLVTGEPKKLAWFWLGVILQDQRDKFTQVAMANGGSGARTPEQETWGHWLYRHTFQDLLNPYDAAEKNKEKETVSYAMWPVYISFTDKKYSNAIDFTITYVATITTSLLGRALGLFEPIYPIGLQPDTWVKYLGEVKAFDERIQPYPDKDILIDICNPLEEEATSSSAQSRSEEAASFASVQVPENGRDWNTYRNSVTFVEESHDFKGKKLKPKGQVPRTDYEGMSPGIRTQLFQNQQPDSEGEVNHFDMSAEEPTKDELANTAFFARKEYSAGTPKEMYLSHPTEATRYVILEGYAERWSGPIAPPSLISVGGVTAYKTSDLGPDIVKTNIHKTGLVNQENKSVDIYQTAWKRHYVLDNVPANSNITSTADPRRFS